MMKTSFPTPQQMHEFGRFLSSLMSSMPQAALYISLVVVVGSAFCTLTIVILRLLDIHRMLGQKHAILELLPSAYSDKTPLATKELFAVLHGLYDTRPMRDKLLRRRASFSLEVVSTREQGIRYLVRMPARDQPAFERDIASYLSDVRFQETEEYAPTNQAFAAAHLLEFRGKKRYYPLRQHISHEEYDPVAYLAGAMTNLMPGEIMSLQLVVSPTKVRHADRIVQRLVHNEEHADALGKKRHGSFGRRISNAIGSSLLAVADTVGEVHHESSARTVQSEQSLASHQQQVALGIKPARALGALEQTLAEMVYDKLSQPLYNASLRTLIITNETLGSKGRMRDARKSLGVFTTKYQAISSRHNFPYGRRLGYRRFMFTQRLPGMFNRRCLLLSAAEVASVYHFPNNYTGKIDNVARSFSRTLPAPAVLKKHSDDANFDVVLGRNYHHGSMTDIGLTAEERERHVYVIGGTGNGKTTMLEYGIVQDIRNGKGVAIVDPHGDSAKKLLRYIPEERMKDVIYFNPRDYDYPVGLNLLELPEGLSGSNLAHEKDLVTEAVISVLSKIFDDGTDANAYRIERVLRNTIHTAFTIEGATLFTVLRLLTEASYRKKMTRNLQDERLRRFWKEELGKAGEMQRVKISGGPVTRIERFESSESAKRVLGQKRSTINFEDIMNSSKILICNFSKGGLGEDTSTLFGTTVLAKLQLAAWRREDIPEEQRVPFYLYVDEFQNFATDSFMSLFSEARKYRLFVTMAQQSVSQLKEQAMLNTILDNVGTIVAFRSKSPETEKLLLHQLSPQVAEGEIANLPSYNFYIKIAATSPLEPSSGKTVVLEDKGSADVAERVIAASRERYASVYKEEASATPNELKKEDTNTAAHDVDAPDIDQPPDA